MAVSSQRRLLTLFALVLVTVLAAIMLVLAYMPQNAKQEELAPDEVTDEILTELSITGMVQLQADQLERHYSLPEGLVEDYSVYISTSPGNGSELACFQLAEQDDYEQLEEAIAKHVAERAQGFKEVNPEAYQQIQGYTLYRNGELVLLSITADNKAVEKYFMALD